VQQLLLLPQRAASEPEGTCGAAIIDLSDGTLRLEAAYSGVLIRLFLFITHAEALKVDFFYHLSILFAHVVPRVVEKIGTAVPPARPNTTAMG
jgi:hypothetical protein